MTGVLVPKLTARAEPGVSQITKFLPLIAQ